ncbi:hypothetical protein ACXR6G_12875 [Ancylomarina sp. YFZ004]
MKGLFSPMSPKSLDHMKNDEKWFNNGAATKKNKTFIIDPWVFFI